MKRLLLLALFAFLTAAHADPRLTSWFTANSGKYARIYTSTANETAGTSAAKSAEGWTRTTNGTTYAQANPAYADVNEINYSASWVYIRTTGLASHIMGPWYLDAAKTQNFPSFPSNTAVIYRIPRTPAIPGTKTLTGLGATGRMVNGVSMFDSRDAFSYKGTPNFTDATPQNGLTGDGIWNRDGYHNEGVTFDPALAHQAGSNYHYHAHPIGLRYQLGDHVDYNPATNRYTESASAPVQHSPIVAWAADGLPVYGPYGFSDPDSATSGVRRMVSGFTLRDGTNGTTAITVREVLPLWAQRIQNKTVLTAAQYGPAVSSTYLLGHYIEDFDFQGDLAGRTQTKGSSSVGGFVLGNYDLNEQNVRFCVTPEFPSGTWAYFTPINADGTPQYPYTTGRAYYGSPTGGARTEAQMLADTPLTQQFIGGANKALAIQTPGVSGTTVTLTWSAVEGGTYSVDASAVSDFSSFTNKVPGVVATGISANSAYTALATSGTEYGRVNRTALATYDTNGQSAATVSQSATTSYSLTPNDPPTITSIANQTTVRNAATSALSFTIGDTETAVTSLTVTASSSNTTLVPNANIVVTGTGAGRSVTVTPALGKSGTATITITVNDGTKTTSTTFTLTVPPPNVLFLIADDYGIDASTLYNTSPGVSLPPTPRIASLAASGVKFTNAYAYPVCSPTRSAMLTGRYGFRTGTGNVASGPSNNLLQASEFTLPEAFAANSTLNYQLKHFGKWHLGGNNQAPCTIGGWPAFAGSLLGQITDYSSWTKVVSDGTGPGTTSTPGYDVYATRDIVNDAVAFIGTQTAAGKPWVAWVAFNAPHTPLHLPPTELCPTYAGLSGTAADITANPLNYFNAMVEAMDTKIGDLLDSMSPAVRANTDIIFIGDNGTAAGTLQAPFPSGRGKDTLYEGGIRVPMIVSGPDVVSGGRSSAVPTHVVDLYSTILEMAGINVAVTVPSGTVLDSQSLLPVLQNQSVTRSLVYDEEFDIADATLGGRSLRDSQYKLIRKAAGMNLTTDEFYDLLADPYEATNLIAGGVGSMTAPRQTAYNSLVTQLGTFNTAPTIGTLANQSTLLNTATPAIAFTIGDAEMSPAILTLTSSSSNTALVPIANIVLGGSGANRTVTITPATGLTGSSTITISANDGIFTTSRSFLLTVTTGSTPTSVSAIAVSPTLPTSTDAVTVTATVTPATSTTLTSVQLVYNTGAGVTATAFSERMGTSPGTWTTANNLGTDNAWTLSNGPNNPYSQTGTANLTGAGTGHDYGLEVNGGVPPPLGNMHITTTNSFNAASISGNATTSGYVEFYLGTASLSGSMTWDLQTTTDTGATPTWTTRKTDPTLASNHAYQYYRYDLSAGELSATLKLRFRFAGSGMSSTVSKYTLDDIKVITTTASVPQVVNMTGPAGGGTFTIAAPIPAQAVGKIVSYTITATDSTTGTATGSGSYTVQTAAPVLGVSPAGGLTFSGNVGGSFSPAGAGYTLTNTGTGTLNWTAGKTAAWLTLSGTGGSLAAGASTTVTASINAAANGLIAGGYNDTITFTATNGTGTTTRGVSLTVNNTTPPAAPALVALPAFSQGTAKTVSWSAVAGATSYTFQVSATSDFSSVLASQTVTNPSASFSNLANGVTYYYRVLATNGIGSSSYSNVVSSTQDTVAPLVAITSPASGTSTATNTIAITGTSSDAISGISKVTVNGVTASTANNFANWNITAPLGFGTNGITAVAYDGAGNVTTTAPVLVTLTTAQTYNPLIIPEVITGTTFDLNLHTATKQFLSGVATNTYAYNNMLFWGPTLILNKGDWVQMNVTNNLADTTTTHWHGFHIPAIMDGGPHQTIPAGTTWRPSFKVDNNAGLYWYHPHLHTFTQQQLTRGGGGLIIIRDQEEAALTLPRTYGVDDIPLALTSRRFLTAGGNTNQFATTNSAYGDYMVVNGTMNPQVTLPRQYVRLRILNAEIERSYNLGFSDGRTFHQIATDGGLVNAPIPLTRLVLGVGERAEILVDLTGDTEGSFLDLQAFNSGQAPDFPGGEPGTTGQFGSLLNNTTFTILRINVGPATANPVTTRPTTLKTNAFWTGTDVTNDRALQITGGLNGATDWSFDNLPFSPTVLNQTLNLNAVERWTITNNSGFSHSFHIHDIQFSMTGRAGGSNSGLKSYEGGWKDTVFIGRNQTVTFIAKFDGFASNTNPFMYHCHFSNHEDEGLMGQFVVVNNAVEDLAIASFTRKGNNSVIQLDFKATPGTTYTLQYSADMTTTSWTDVGSMTSDGSSATFIETSAARLGQPRGFYRVKIPAIP